MEVRERGKIASISLIVALVLGGLFLMWAAIRILLILFAGVLLAIFLRALTKLLSRLTTLSKQWSYPIVLVSLILILVLSALILFPSVSVQIDRLSDQLPDAVDQLRERIAQYEWGKWLASRTMEQISLEPRAIATAITGAVTSLVVVLFVGVYLAADASTYKRGLVKLVPVKKRKRAEEVLLALEDQLESWLIGRAISMSAVGVLTIIGLWWLKIPLALTLGLIAAVLSFVPYIGPLLSVVPALILAFPIGLNTTFWVLVLYLGIQLIESYLLTPHVQKHAAELPPALTISSQILLGTLIGAWGLIVATPLAAAALVFVRMVYVQDFLSDSEV